jgi:hypothetical protein
MLQTMPEYAVKKVPPYNFIFLHILKKYAESYTMPEPKNYSNNILGIQLEVLYLCIFVE